MSKSITIIRHAKSSWESAEGDHQRPLNDRGHADARLIGEHIAQRLPAFDTVYCSQAKRARQTFQNLNTSLHIDATKVHQLSALYLAELIDLLAIINGVESFNENIIVIGHNPGLTMLCNYLTNDNMSNLPTCGVYTIALQVSDWRAVDQGVGVQKYFCTPRILKDAG